MNIEEYISSGVLESYVLGELSAEERVDVEKKLLLYPELKRELTLIEETQEQLLIAMGARPREEAKKKLFEKIGQNIPVGKQVLLKSGSPLTFWKFAAAASVAVAIVAVYLAYEYRSRWKRTETDLSNIITQNQRIAEDYNTVNKRIDQFEKDVEIMDDPDFKRVVMKGTENAPEALAYIYWNENSQEVYLNIHNMRALANETQYQLWAIIDGKPVDAGVFDVPSSGLLKMKTVANGAATFAVTVEPKGGSPSPSLQTLQVAGNVDKG